jgi:hypothetical protein
MRRPVLVLVALVLAAVALPAAPASAARTCPSADLRYPFEPGGPRTFGVFRLRVDGGGCAGARRVAREWMRRFEADLSRGRVVIPKSVLGYRFVVLRPDAAQTYAMRGRRGSVTVRFDYVVPNG